jgi:hypothetical protein
MQIKCGKLRKAKFERSGANFASPYQSLAHLLCTKRLHRSVLTLKQY